MESEAVQIRRLRELLMKFPIEKCQHILLAALQRHQEGGCFDHDWVFYVLEGGHEGVLELTTYAQVAEELLLWYFPDGGMFESDTDFNKALLSLEEELRHE